MNTDRKLYRLMGHVQHYDWGGFRFLPELLGVDNRADKPFAEYWLGTHPRLSSDLLVNGDKKPLNEIVFLPFLFKVLDIRKMLSIQVHPTKKGAEIEFERENIENIPLDAPNRNYRDDNHKPELAVALSTFWLLHGFKSKAEMRNTIGENPEFSFLLPSIEDGSYEAMFKNIMGMPQENVNDILGPLADRIIPKFEKGELKKTDPGYWAARAAIDFTVDNNIDRGVFSVYFLNLVRLEKGEGIFQAAGVPHAYLEGQIVELMANSDNVLRGGLTSKHVDAKELMKHIRCEPVIPQVVKPAIKDKELLYPVPVRDFNLVKLKFGPDDNFRLTVHSHEILFLLDGEILIEAEAEQLTMTRGQAVILFPGAEFTIKSVMESELYRARQGFNSGE